MKTQSCYISDKSKKIILERQNHRCANNPDVNLFRIGDFSCPLWESTRRGVFTDPLYEIDHVIEFSLTSDNNIENLQALCSYCHSFKTKSFRKELSLARKKGIIGDYDGTTKVVSKKKLANENSNTSGSDEDFSDIESSTSYEDSADNFSDLDRSTSHEDSVDNFSDIESSDTECNVNKPARKKNVCPKCGVTLGSRSSYHYHIRRDDCTTKVRGNLGKRRNGEKVQKKVTCNVCNKEYDKGNYVRHLKTDKHIENLAIYNKNDSIDGSKNTINGDRGQINLDNSVHTNIDKSVSNHIVNNTYLVPYLFYDINDLTTV
uniref:HNH domain-containing protein n=1 Tax=viral metagenome TaxID=1070528 RepID=A0A6C0C9J9_9ZZZZ